MSRAVSIHIGVNRPGGGNDTRAVLQDSEHAAWRMAEMANQAGYDSIQVLRGATATLAAVHDALHNASQLLERGDLLLVTFSGHGGQVEDEDGDDESTFDEAWSLLDGELLDDELFVGWRRFRPGVRIVVVSESCYSGGMYRDDEITLPGLRRRRRRRHRRRVTRGEPAWAASALADYTASCFTTPPIDDCGIEATVLMLTAAAERQEAESKAFTDSLVGIWSGGSYTGTYCELYGELKKRVSRIKSSQHPQLIMLGAPDLNFPHTPAFRRISRDPGPPQGGKEGPEPRDPGPPPRDPRDDDWDDDDLDDMDSWGGGRPRKRVYR